MEIKLIASDMDDTLLNSQCQISPRNEAALSPASLHTSYASDIPPRKKMSGKALKRLTSR